jgi:hypothetical protein
VIIHEPGQKSGRVGVKEIFIGGRLAFNRKIIEGILKARILPSATISRDRRIPIEIALLRQGSLKRSSDLWLRNFTDLVKINR